MDVERFRRLAGVVELIEGYRVVPIHLGEMHWFNAGRFRVLREKRENLTAPDYQIEQVPDGLRGGIITFSTDVNATGGSGLIGKIKSWLQTQLNRYRAADMVTKQIDTINKNSDEQIGGFSIGNFIQGRFFDPDTGKRFDERSLSVEIVYISSPTLKRIGAIIAKAFGQKSVLIRDNNDGKLFFLNMPA